MRGLEGGGKCRYPELGPHGGSTFSRWKRGRTKYLCIYSNSSYHTSEFVNEEIYLITYIHTYLIRPLEDGNIMHFLL